MSRRHQDFGGKSNINAYIGTTLGFGADPYVGTTQGFFEFFAENPYVGTT